MSSSSIAAAPPHVVEDCRGVLQVLSDGTIIRTTSPAFSTPVPDDGSVEWKDVQYDATHDLHLRLYRPRGPTTQKLPLLFYFHGGGFCIGHRTWSNFHAVCLRLSSSLPAIVLSADYRLAPEHRLPAAFMDGAAAVSWLRDQHESPDPWLAEGADFGRVFISGESAGGTITHHLANLYISSPPSPLRVRGYVLSMPAFGGTRRTRSEEESGDGDFLTMEMVERYWRLALPVGATADDPLVNPFAPGAEPLSPAAAAAAAPMVVVVGGRDLLRDREVEYVKWLKGLGRAVELVEFPGQQHAFFTVEPWSEAADEMVGVFKKFVEEN